MKYQNTNTLIRADLNGLRFISVIAVILFHSKISFFNSGFIGVDIFFVLSGFFITQILIKEKNNKKNINILNFLNKRFRRIVPALVFVIILSSLIMYFFLYEKEHAKVLKDSIFYSSIFLSNYYFYQYFGNYFVQSSDYITLFHSWSLSIEIQFYLFCSIFFFIIFKINFLYKNIKIIIIFFLVFSLTMTQMGANFKSSFPYIETEGELYFFNQPWWSSFYFPLSRLWEFLFGSLAAISLIKKKLRGNKHLSFLGILLILISFIFINDSTIHPSIITILPVFGTYLIIVFNQKDTYLYNILGSNSFNWGGLVSYSAYLIHYPLFVFFRINYPNNFDQILIFLIIITFLVSHFMWKYIENPFRDYKKISNKKFFILLFISYIIIFSCINVYDRYKENSLNKISNKYFNINLDIKNQVEDRKKYFNNISSTKNFKNGSIEKSNIDFLVDERIKILIVGNSHAKDLFSIFNQNKDIFNDYQFRYYRTQVATFLSEGLDIEKTKYFLNDDLFKNADVIFVSTNFRVYGNYSKDFEGLQKLLEIANKNKKKFVLSSNSPFFKNYRSPVLDIVYRHRNINLSENKINTELYKLIDKKKLNFNKKLKKFSVENNIKYLDKIKFICNENLKSCKSFDKNGNVTILDSSHYTLEGAKFFGEEIYKLDWFIF